MRPFTPEEICEDQRIRKSVAKLLRDGRQKKRLTIREVVLYCKEHGWNTGPTTLNRIESGLVNLGISRILLLSKFYGITRSQIMGI